jgi:beta-xylosidase
MFDPSLFFDNDGKVYYQRRGPGDGENIVQAEIDVRTGKLLTPLRTISTGFVTADSEGPHLYKIDEWYYLSEAEGSTRTAPADHRPLAFPVGAISSRSVESMGHPAHRLGLSGPRHRPLRPCGDA